MPICIDEHVFGLDIPVNDIVGVSVLDSKKLNDRIRGSKVIELAGTYKFRHVKPYSFYIEWHRSSKLLEIASREVLLSRR